MTHAQQTTGTVLSESETRHLTETLLQILEPHLQSFNSAITQGLQQVLHDIEPLILEGTVQQAADHVSKERLEVWFEDLRLQKPRLPRARALQSTGNLRARGFADELELGLDPSAILPHQCRALQSSYTGSLSVVLCWRATRISHGCYRKDSTLCNTALWTNGSYAEDVYRSERHLGEVPILVGSKLCHLDGLSPNERVALHEEEYDYGGYFIVNGVEKLLRMVIMPRANHVMVIARDANVRRGEHFTRFSAMIRCRRADRVRVVTNHLHYLQTGLLRLRFSVKRQEYLLPLGLVLKALYDLADRELFLLLTMPSGCCGTNADENLRYIRERALMTVRELHVLTGGEGTQHAALSYLGARFRCLFPEYLSSDDSDERCGAFILRRYVLIHLDDPLQKLELLAYMSRKLLHYMTGCLAEDDPDSLANQELLLPGQLWLLFLQEKLQDALFALRDEISRQLTQRANQGSLLDPDFVRKCVSKPRSGIRVGERMLHLLSTGTASLRDGAELLQTSGYSIIADRINFQRFLSHFYSVHRGQYFLNLRTSESRKLKPETWGFICPVHTPDGAPCGILNHLTRMCRVVADQQQVLQEQKRIEWILETLPLEHPLAHNDALLMPPANARPVLVDGRIRGYVHGDVPLGKLLRQQKLEHFPQTEIVDVEIPRLFPSVMVFSTPSRLMRSVWNMPQAGIEWIGTMEQLFMPVDLCKSQSMSRAGNAAIHRELSATNIFSLLASFIPFSNMNQSPRNIYQCQMGKQAMGVPFHDWDRRFDTKSYRLLTPQQPLVQNRSEAQAGWSKVFGSSFNAVVAVISYTGYDMEDGMVINRASLDRGLAHGAIYGCEFVDLDQLNVAKDARFSRLPAVGERMTPGSVLYSIQGRRPHLYRNSETSYVDAVLLAENQRRVAIRTRTPRRPVIGDKFASRHGQKGVLSAIWPAEDMPYTSDGIVPDILFNPNGFPSRMTIGMIVESIAGKAAAVHGAVPIDASAFERETEDASDRSNEPPHDFFGRLLLNTGYTYHGTETMYNGYTGEPFVVQIFIGVIAWQRLRHHIADKFQVRTEGIVHQTLRQPLRGRKRGGAIRLGEMERDALLASGAAYTLQDRLQSCSDLHTVYVSALDGSLLAPIAAPNERLGATSRISVKSRTNTRSPVVRVHMPYAFKYLVYELAAMNIRVSLPVK
ncbi:RNA polymerase I second largest subunit [Cyanidioschyzon merolae strain 10D]|uniref:DNA-directed RNA polymerase subunit beta n=1 Tax=Cyanidioschyzon merolae (strain NIES-3377 / 10D) TaxID=280699 RepID=M1UWS4_CYAM1|nr:RNA polymerase I second largest subunit [Cyanidioschyzon merolae strain 10D]BAM82746.1 RNA polymerase I second largest subunit [Cyanidioschyzon merolae strain 10D]|eukprot:XP_005538782.1 RNA polymerase I second largest subunit [Cyanidioschyzon merolae strain 10D]